MQRHTSHVLGCAALLISTVAAVAQTDPDPAMNNPDKISWQLFISVNSRAGGANAVFETFASDTDTFQPNPQYPAGPAPSALHPPILEAFARDAALRSGVLLPALPPNPNGLSEETRHNRVTFDFIVQNNLYKVSGLKAAFGKTLTFPVDSVEVKANWVPVNMIPSFTKNQVTVAQVPQLYHVNADSNGNKYALVSMHVISKQVPNWTWVTFEHRFNPGRCDIMGCRDAFGAQTPVGAAKSDARADLSGLHQVGRAVGAAGKCEHRAGLCQLLPQGLADRFRRQYRSRHSARQLGDRGRLRRHLLLHDLPRPRGVRSDR